MIINQIIHSNRNNPLSHSILNTTIAVEIDDALDALNANRILTMNNSEESQLIAI